MPQRPKQLYEFGPFRLDAAEQVLLRDGELVPLTRKAVETLLVLVERSGHVVEKEEFFKEIWADAFVEDGSLTVNISLLRKALGRDESGKQYIETVPRRGYRFVADVRVSANSVEAPHGAGRNGGPAARWEETIAAVAAAPSAASDAAPVEASVAAPAAVAPPRRITHRKWAVVILLAVMICALAAVGYFKFFGRKNPRDAAQPRTLAVLPFLNLKPDPESDFLSFSLANVVTAKLGNVHTLVVRPSASVYKYRNQPLDPQRVAEELKADTLLTGSYLREGDKLYITAQLIDVSTNTIIWQDTLNLRYEKLSTGLDQVSQRIIKELALKLTPTDADRLRRDTPNDTLAYEYYLRGVDFYFAEDYLAAIDALKKSVERDAEYPRAWAQLGSAYSVHASLNFGGREFYAKAQEAYERALALDPDRTEAKAYLADLLVDTNRFEQAAQLMREVLEGEPENALARWELSYAYRFGGMLAESIEEGERSRASDPTLELASAPFSAYLYSGQYEKFVSRTQIREDSALLLFYRGLARYYLKDWERAAADFRRAYELDPSLLASQVGMALLHGLQGRGEEGLKILREAEAKVASSGVIDGESVYKIAQGYAVLNDRRAALRMLRRSIVEGGFVCYPYFSGDPLLENIRSEAEYGELLETARSRHEEFKKRFFG